MFEKLQADYRRFLEIEQALLDPAVTADVSRVTALSKERGRIAKMAVLYGRYLDLGKQIEEAEALLDAESDADMRSYAEGELAILRGRQETDAENLRNLLYDRESGADHAAMIVEIRAGAGGDEAALFARDLYEMYRRYSETMGWKFELLDMEATELGGFREVSFSLNGEGAFRCLQFESGGHRVQRVPQTETQGRIHTSAATVAVLPEPEDVEIEIRNEDLQIDVMRSGGPGGQHQNKTESGVRITHLPSGIVVNCRDERSQHKNKAKAFRVLRTRLYDQLHESAQNQRDQARRTLIGSGDRSQRIRTYNFPQNRVTDHRIGLTLYNLDQVIQGDLAGLTKALIDHDRREQLGDI
ncbi:peptide chain release factor 1 [Paludisphaera borealis]|uniref:Peptide chain release factor 1 n=1 Tax=Paludisphaera borealis TaxID=1387353 RepID=A0A1U7CVY9_9BACT|nr:peptide chain release factor 1 [Paludisphaera borealis]APW63120.1 Peptide chain release factor 1 [Paludisphaera borealis]